jgi:hypothetical protein
MDEKRLRGLMGLSVRAGQAAFGEEGCRKLILQEGCGVLMLDAGASANTRERYERLCAAQETQMAVLPEGLIQEATGRSGAAMALRSGSFSEQVTSCLQTEG